MPHKLGQVPGGESDHVIGDQYLAIGMWSGADADGGDRYRLVDRCSHVDRHTFNQDCKCARLFGRHRIGDQLVGVAVDAIAPFDVNVLGAEPDMRHHRNSRRDDRFDATRLFRSTLQLDGVALRLLQNADAAFDAAIDPQLAFGKGKIDHHHRAPTGAADHLGVIDHLIHGDRQRRLVTLDDHRQRVTHQDHIDAGRVQQLGGWEVVGGQHGDPLAAIPHPLQASGRDSGWRARALRGVRWRHADLGAIAVGEREIDALDRAGIGVRRMPAVDTMRVTITTMLQVRPPALQIPLRVPPMQQRTARFWILLLSFGLPVSSVWGQFGVGQAAAGNNGQAASNTVIEFKGTLKSFDARRGVIVVSREDGTEAMVYPPENLASFQFVATAKPAFLQRGMLVRFSGLFGPGGVPQAPIDQVVLFQPVSGKGLRREQFVPGVYPQRGQRSEQGQAVSAVAKYDVVGNVVGISPQGVMMVRAGRVPLQIPLAAEATFELCFNNLALAQVGDPVAVAGFYQPPDDSQVRADRVTITPDRVYGEPVAQAPRRRTRRSAAERRADDAAAGEAAKKDAGEAAKDAGEGDPGAAERAEADAEKAAEVEARPR